MLSDYRYSAFGLKYGFLIKELNLLARGSIIIDAHDYIRYVQVVPEITQAVNFKEVFSKLQEILTQPLAVKKFGFWNRV